MAINTSSIVGQVRAISSGVSSFTGDKLKYRVAVSTLSTIITARFTNERFIISASFIAIESPTPTIGPISGLISIAPITTAVLLTLRPILATKMENIRIHALCPLKGISLRIASTVVERSVSSRISRRSFKNCFIDSQTLCASSRISSLGFISNSLGFGSGFAPILSLFSTILNYYQILIVPHYESP